MDIDDPHGSGNRVYAIRQDVREAYCLCVNCSFECQVCDGIPYIHVAPVAWLDRKTVFVAQNNGISLKIDVESGKIEFLAGMLRTLGCYASDDGRHIAFSPIAEDVSWAGASA